MKRLWIALIAAVIVPLGVAAVTNAAVTRGEENIVVGNKKKPNYFASSNCPDNSLCLFENEKFNPSGGR